jgi:hypothetical protein
MDRHVVVVGDIHAARGLGLRDCILLLLGQQARAGMARAQHQKN